MLNRKFKEPFQFTYWSPVTF